MVVILGALYFGNNQSSLSNFMPFAVSSPEKQIKINDTVISVEVADTQPSRSGGYRKGGPRGQQGDAVYLC